MQTFAYIIQQALPYKNARDVTPQPSRKGLLFQLGQILTEIHKIEVVGYGADFNAITGCFSHETFAEHLAQKISSIESAQLSPQLTRWLVSRTESLTAIHPRPLLSHRDILANPGNILVDTRGEIRAIIDWEMASSGLAFHSEVASLIYTRSRNGQSNADIEHDLQAFLDGYGISYRHYKQFYQRDVDTVVLLNGVSAIVKHSAVARTALESLQPWRADFAKRAIKLCEMHFAQDAATLKRYRIAA
jgi:serine/threonine protein kinase